MAEQLFKRLPAPARSATLAVSAWLGSAAGCKRGRSPFIPLNLLKSCITNVFVMQRNIQVSESNKG